MSIYDNGTSKIYPDLKLNALQEPKIYRLKKSTEIEAYLLDEIEVRKGLGKKMKLFNIITSMVDTGLIRLTVVTGGVSIAAFGSDAELSVGITLALLALLLQ